MRRSHIDNPMWSFHNLWPELCQTNRVKHSARKKDFTNIGDDNATVILDNFEYPELGCDTLVKTRRSLVPREDSLPSSSLQILIPMQTNMEPKKSKFLKRYKRPDRICINLQEALESTRCISKTNGKEVSKLSISIYNGNLGIPMPNIIDKSRQSDFRKVRICISKDKKPSRLKKIILVNRDMKARINIQKRVAFERAKLEAVGRDVDAIDFNALRITADPEIEVDYVRNLGTMSLYDKSYRSTNEVNISDDTVSARPDVIEKIHNLKIQGRQATNRLMGPASTAVLSELKSEIIEDDIVERTLSLQIEEDIKREVQNSTEVDSKDFVKFSRNFREYCTNIATPCLNDSLEKFLQEVTRLQKRCHEKNPNKSKYKRRYYSGLKEVRKHADLKKLKFVIIAPDIEKVEVEGGLEDHVNKLIDTCKRQNIVFCFGLRRRKLGYYTHGKGFVGCIGIANYGGTESLFTSVLTELVHARNAFKKQNGGAEATIDISKVVSEDNLPSENINALLKVLSHYMQS